MPRRAVVFLHGAFMTPLAWERWLSWFAARGYRCLALAWPGRDRKVADLRAAHPDAGLARLRLGAIVDHIAAEVAAFDQKPIVVGHSTGGLVAQLLVNRDAVAAGVAIHSAAPAGVFTTNWSYLRSRWTFVVPFADARAPKALTFPEFQSAYANALPPDAQMAAFERYIVPESRLVAFRAASVHIDFVRSHPPLLMTAGVLDRVTPASLNFNNFARYRQRGSITDFRAFDGRDHLVIVEPGWEEVASFVADWLERVA